MNYDDINNVNFEDLIRENKKTKEQYKKEKEEQEKAKKDKLIKKFAEAQYRIIKQEIFDKAKTGDYENGIISGYHKLPCDTQEVYSYNNAPDTYNSVIIERKHEWKRGGAGVLGYKDKHFYSVKVANFMDLIKIDVIIKILAKRDNIEISSPFLLSVIKENGKVVSSTKTFWKNQILYAEIKYNKFTNPIFSENQDGSIDLVIEYSYKL